MSNLYLYACYNCKQALSLKEVLDNAYLSSIEDYIGFTCPNCGHKYEAELLEGQINFGVYDRGLRRHAIMRTPKLTWQWNEQQCCIEDSGRQWILKEIQFFEDEAGNYHHEINGKKWLYEKHEDDHSLRYIPREEK